MHDPVVDTTPAGGASIATAGPVQGARAARGGLMGRVSNIKIGRRLIMASAAVLGLTILVGVFGASRLKSTASSFSQDFTAAVQRQSQVDDMQTAVVAELAGLRGFLVSGEDKRLERFDEATSAFKEMSAQVLAKTASQEGKDLLARIDEQHAAVAGFYKEQIAMRRANNLTAAMALEESKVKPARDVLEGTIDEYAVFQDQRVAQRNADALASADKTVWILVSVLAGAVALGLLLALLLTRSVVRPLRRLEDASSRAAQGDLTVQVGSESRDEVGQVSRSFDGMLANFRDIVGKVADAAKTQTQAAREMAQASTQSGQAVGQIAATVEDIARGASEQAEGTQRVTTTVDEMTRGVAQVAQGGQAATVAAQQADEVAASGTQVVAEATEAIGRISERVEDAATVVTGLGEKGQAIGEIVGTIDQIASQTNLLALNAAIEAARASEQGRGFAVVAEEVRKLAEESQQAAASIGDIIRDIQEETGRAVEAMVAGRTEVQSGVESVGKAGDAFGEIRAQVERVSGEVTQVAAAAQQLEAGAQQVQEQIAAVAAVSEENAAAAQQVAASTEETTASSEQVASSAATLSSDAETLAGLVAQFRV